MLASQAGLDQMLRQKLPPEALEKLLKLMAVEDALVASFNAVFHQIQPARDRARETGAKYTELEKLNPRAPAFQGTDTGVHRYRPPIGDPEAVQREILKNRDRVLDRYREERDGAAEQLQRLEREAEQIRSRTSPVPARVINWVRALPSSAKVEMHRGQVRAPEGQPAEVVEQLRRRLVELRVELEATQNAPIPSSTARKIIAAEISRLAEHGRPDLMRVCELAIPPRFASSPVMDGANMPTLHKYFDGVALIAWLAHDQLLEALDRELAEVSDDANALDPDQRRRREQELRLDMLLVERQEEMTIEAAEQNGMQLKRRDNACPIAILGLADSLLVHWEGR